MKLLETIREGFSTDSSPRRGHIVSFTGNAAMLAYHIDAVLFPVSPLANQETIEKRTTAWLIERANFKPEDPRPHWYAENGCGPYWWTPVAEYAKRFATEADVRADPTFKMIAADPNISVTEHVFWGG